jgi:hypothetical protein
MLYDIHTLGVLKIESTGSPLEKMGPQGSDESLSKEEVQVTSKGKACIGTSCATFLQQYAGLSCKFQVETRVSPPMADIVTISCCGLAPVLHAKAAVTVLILRQRLTG